MRKTCEVADWENSCSIAEASSSGSTGETARSTSLCDGHRAFGLCMANASHRRTWILLATNTAALKTVSLFFFLLGFPNLQ